MRSGTRELIKIRDRFYENERAKTIHQPPSCANKIIILKITFVAYFDIFIRQVYPPNDISQIIS